MDEANCDEEVYFLCAQAHSTAKDVDFLACMDSSSSSAGASAQKCASSVGIEWSDISTCFNGDEGTTLKKNAALYFDKRFTKSVMIPHVEINGEVQDDLSEQGLIKALCATGITAGACNKHVVV